MTDELWVSPEAARELLAAKRESVGRAQTDDFIVAAARGAEAVRRKGTPVYSGFVAYFPDAILAVAELSRIGNDQHNPGQPLHWSRDKSSDHQDCLMRHTVDVARGEPVDADGVLHKTKVAWRAMADLQLALEGENSKPQKLAEPSSDEWHPLTKEETQEYLDRLNTGWSIL